MRLREFFYLPKSDRTAVIILLIVAVLAFLIIYNIGRVNDTSTVADNDSVNVQKSPISSRKTARSEADGGYYAVPQQKVERFQFDPNTADSTALLRLGLQPWQVRSIYRYRAKGGVFRKKTDFARLYGLTAKQYRELEPYISISPDYLPAADIYAEKRENRPFHRDSLTYSPKIGPTERVNLNTADTSLLKRIPGIGSYYARRIVYYRQRLGGFVSTDQLAEIEDFPMESAIFMTIDTTAIKKMNVNRLTWQQMRRHPYMGFHRAKAISDYRRLKGNLHSLNDLRLLPEFSADAIKRLSPYVEF